MKHPLFSYFKKNFALQIQQFRVLSLRVRENQNKETVHHLRITARRLRAMLWILQKKTQFAQTRPLNPLLKHVVDTLGELRDLDMAAQDAALYNMAVPHFHRYRQIKINKVLRCLDDRNRKIILDSLDHAKSLLNERFDFPCNTRLKVLEQTVEKSLKETLRRRDLHPLRISMKKVRYVIEAFGRSAKPLRKLQEKIGDAHDLEILGKLVGKNKFAEKDRKRLQTAAKKQVKVSLNFARQQLRTIRHLQNGRPSRLQ